MSEIQTKIPSDTWVTATWDEFIQLMEDPIYEKAKCYYYNGKLRLEMSAVGSIHADDNGIVVLLIYSFSIVKIIPMKLLINCSYRQPGSREVQPDISYYIGERVNLAPRSTSIANVNNISPPDLAIEIADSSLLDDLGMKRMLYEEMGVAEYWVVDVKQAQIIAFKIIANGGSQRIYESLVLPGLAISLLEEGLKRNQQLDHTSVGTWFLETVRSAQP